MRKEAQIIYQFKVLICSYIRLHNYLNNKSYKNIFSDYSVIAGLKAFITSRNPVDLLHGHSIFAELKSVIENLDNSIQSFSKDLSGKSGDEHYLIFLREIVDKVDEIDDDVNLIDCLFLLCKRIFLPNDRIEKSREDQIEEQFVYIYFQLKINSLFKFKASIESLEAEFINLKSSYTLYCQSGGYPEVEYYQSFVKRCDFLILEIEKYIVSNIKNNQKNLDDNSIFDHGDIKAVIDSVIKFISSIFKFSDDAKDGGFFEQINNIGKINQDYLQMGANLKLAQSSVVQNWFSGENIDEIKNIISLFLKTCLLHFDLIQLETQDDYLFITEAVNEIIKFVLPFGLKDAEQIWQQLENSRLDNIKKRLDLQNEQIFKLEKTQNNLSILLKLVKDVSKNSLSNESIEELYQLADALNIDQIMVAPFLESSRNINEYKFIDKLKYYANKSRVIFVNGMFLEPAVIREYCIQKLSDTNYKLTEKLSQIKLAQKKALKLLNYFKCSEFNINHTVFNFDQDIGVIYFDALGLLLEQQTLSIKESETNAITKNKKSKNPFNYLQKIIEDHILEYFQIDLSKWNKYLSIELNYPQMLINLFEYLKLIDFTQEHPIRRMYLIPNLILKFNKQVDTVFFQFKYIESITYRVIKDCMINHFGLLKSTITRDWHEIQIDTKSDSIILQQLKNIITELDKLNLSYKNNLHAVLQQALENTLINLYKYSQNNQSIIQTIYLVRNEINLIVNITNRILNPNTQSLLGVISNVFSNLIYKATVELDVTLLEIGYLKPFIPYDIEKQLHRLHTYNIVAMDNVIIERILSLSEKMKYLTETSTIIRYKHYINGLFHQLKKYNYLLAKRLNDSLDVKGRNLLFIQERINAIIKQKIESNDKYVESKFNPTDMCEDEQTLFKLNQRQLYLQKSISDLKKIAFGDMLAGQYTESRKTTLFAANRLRLEANYELIQKYEQIIGHDLSVQTKQQQLLAEHIQYNYSIMAADSLTIKKMLGQLSVRLRNIGTTVPDLFLSQYEATNYRLKVIRELFSMLARYNKRKELEPENEIVKEKILAVNRAISELNTNSPVDVTLKKLYGSLDSHQRKIFKFGKTQGQKHVLAMLSV